MRKRQFAAAQNTRMSELLVMNAWRSSFRSLRPINPAISDFIHIHTLALVRNTSDTYIPLQTLNPPSDFYNREWQTTSRTQFRGPLCGLFTFRVLQHMPDQRVMSFIRTSSATESIRTCHLKPPHSRVLSTVPRHADRKFRKRSLAPHLRSRVTNLAASMH